MGEFYQAGEGDFFVQTERSEPFEHLTCVGVGDLPLPLGDLTPVYCPDPASKGKFVIEGYIQGEAGMGSTTLTKPLAAVANWLLENDCGFEAFVTYACRGIRALASNYQLGAVLFGARPTTSTLLAAVAKGPDEEGRIETSAEINYLDRRLIYRIALERQALTNTADANAIFFLPKACESKCGPARGLCQEGYMALDGTQYNAEVKYTKNGGATWTQAAVDPFLYFGGDTLTGVGIEIADGHRAIFGRAAAVDEFAEVAITEDWGASWDNVYVGTVLNQAINKLLYYGGKLWAACSGGYIYVSGDVGDTWTAQESAVETAQDLNDLVMYSLLEGYAVGNANAFLYTTDGADWNARTGPAVGTNLLSVTVNDKGHVFVGAADGNLYVSEDAGVTWATRREFGAGSIDWVEFDVTRRYFGALVYNTAAGVGTLYRSFDGGASWERPSGQTAAWNSGLNSGAICDQNNIVVVGEAHGGTTFVAKASPTA